MSSSPTLNRFQNAVVSILFDRIDLQDPVTPLEFRLAGNFQGVFNAVVGIPDHTDEHVMVVATLPRYNKTVFIGLTRSGELDVARVLANLEDLERENEKPLKLGDVISHPDGSDSKNGIFSTIIMPVATAFILRPLSSVCNVNDQEVRFVLVLPLSPRELECRNKLGHDAMIDIFQQEGKDLFFH